MQPPSPDASADVVVIGAGLAGLAAARHLAAAGRTVVVLEARERVGGRAHTHRLDSGHTIDLGAQLIGDVQTRVSALVDEIGLTRVSLAVDGDVLHIAAPGESPRRVGPDKDGLGPFGQLDLYQAMLRAEVRMRDLHRADVDRLDSMTAEEYLRSVTFLDSSYDLVAALLEDGLCVPLDEISGYEMLEQIASAGGLEAQDRAEEWFLAEGTQPIAAHLEAQLPAGTVLRNAPVSRVEVHDGVARVTSAGGVITAPHVVVAFPPQFYEPTGVAALLPEVRRRAVEGWVRPDVVKTILVFDRPFWREQGLSGTFHTPGGFANSTVDASPAAGGAGVLILFSTSTTARRLQGRDEPTRVADAVGWLREILGEDVPWPVAARSVDWSGDPWSLGGYAGHRALGGWATASDLFEPVGPVHFAGTETADEWRGFMEGALQSGERAAAEILGA
jgi:monoamine oxidase